MLIQIPIISRVLTYLKCQLQYVKGFSPKHKDSRSFVYILSLQLANCAIVLSLNLLFDAEIDKQEQALINIVELTTLLVNSNLQSIF